MKKSNLAWIPAVLMALFVTACSHDENAPGTSGNDDGVITFTVNPDYGVKTRADGPKLPSGKSLRYIMEVYNAETQELVAGSRTVKTVTDSKTPVSFTLEKTLGTAFTVAFWADFTATGAPETDVCYDTTTGGLKAVTFKTNPTDGTAEAFSGFVGVSDAGLATANKVVLKHSVAQVNLKTTAQLTGFGSVKVSYGEAANASAPMSVFNALDGTVTTAASIDGIVNTVNASTSASESSPYSFHTFYVFAPAERKGIINMTVDLCTDDAGNNPSQSTEISGVPLRANYKTNITGDFSLAPNIFTITCDGGFEAEELAPSVWDGTKPAANPAATFSGGTGTESDPYIIGKAMDLAQLAANVNDGTAYSLNYFKQTVDIDLNNEEWVPIGGENGKAFKGDDYDGEHHRVYNMKITTGYYNTGLFGKAQNIDNLHVNGNIDIKSGNVMYCGGVVADAIAIHNCSFSGNISCLASNTTIGGVCGTVYNEIKASKNTGNITGTFRVGGVIGNSTRSGVIACYNEGTIAIAPGQNGTPAGIVSTGGTAIAACYNIGTVSLDNSSAHGATVGSGGYSNILAPCYVKDKYTTTLSGENEKVFGDGWPTGTGYWKAGDTADGTDTNGYWKSLGSWNNGVNPEYPKLWWEK